MTVKLFENDSLLKECTAEVTACTAKGGKYLVELDQTVFYPEGGGQLSDQGKIADAAVSHVCEKDGHIYHECDQPLAVGSRVAAVIDWKIRLDRMQQHAGEHLLSYACWKLFQAYNVGFHMNEESVFIDLDKELAAEELFQAELYANELIWENRPIHISYMDSREAAALKDKMRKFNDAITGTLRIVTVEGADVCTCCGTHPPFTGMIGSVKGIRHERHKGGCRIEFVCGRRALKDADLKNSTLLAAADRLSVKPEQVPDAITKQHDDCLKELSQAKNRLLAIAEKKLQAAYESTPEDTTGSKIIALALEEYDAKDIKNLTKTAAALAGAISILLAVQPERVSYAVVKGTEAAGDCRRIIKELNAVFHGRGGGKEDCAQGGADFCQDWQEKLAAVLKTIGSDGASV